MGVRRLVSMYIAFDTAFWKLQMLMTGAKMGPKKKPL
jgi:hypothetical protein